MRENSDSFEILNLSCEYDFDSIIDEFNHQISSLNRYYSQNNLLKFQKSIIKIYDLFRDSSPILSEYAFKNGFIKFLFDIIKKQDEYFKESINLLSLICNESHLIHFINDYEFWNLTLSKFYEILEAKAFQDNNTIIINLMMLLAIYFGSLNKFHMKSNINLDLDILKLSYNHNSVINDNLNKLIASYFKYIAEVDDPFTAIQTIFCIIQDEVKTSINIPDLTQILVQIYEILSNDLINFMKLDFCKGFYDTILHIAIFPSIICLESNLNFQTSEERLCKNSQNALKIVYCFACNDFFLNSIIENFQYIFDTTREDEYFVIALELFYNHPEIIKCINDSEIINKLVRWLYGSKFEYKIHCLNILSSLFSMNFVQDIFNSIFNPLICQEIANMILDCDDARVVKSCMILCKIFVENAILLNCNEIIEIIKTIDMYNAIHDDVTELLPDDDDITEIINYLDSVFCDDSNST